MRNLKLAALFCQPTLVSGITVLLATVGLLGVANLSYLNRSGQLYDFIFGPGTPIDLIQHSRDGLGAINQTVFGNPVVNQVLFIGFWMMVGLFIYITIAVVGQTLKDTSLTVSSLRYLHARQKLVKENFILRMAFRVSGVIAGILYVWLFIRFILPFCIFSTRVGLSQLDRVTGLGYTLLGFLVLLVMLHGAVIIARLVAVRPRVYGGWDSLLLNKKT